MNATKSWALALCVSASLTGILSACGGQDAERSLIMPGVEGKRLDVAVSDLDRAGIEKDKVEVVGGGTFGVVNESNWTVCEQSPAPGAEAESVRVVVDRECDRAESSTTEATPQQSEPDPTDAVRTTTTEEEAPPETFTMPDLVGTNLQDAQDLLQSLGSYLMDQEDASGLGRLQLNDSNWVVCSQTPKAGKKVPLEKVVTLAAVKLDESCP